MKLLGTIELWFADKPTGPFGFVVIKTPVSDGGFAVDRYFLHASRIKFVMSEVKAGCLVRFGVEQARSKKLNAYPVCIDAEVFDALEAQSNQCKFESTGIRTLAGSPNEQLR